MSHQAATEPNRDADTRSGARLRGLASRFLVVLDQGLLSGFSFLTTLMLLRGMGLDGFGVYALLALGWLWALGIVQALITQPMQTLVGARTGRRRARYLASCHTLAWWASLVAALASMVVVWLWGLGFPVACAFACFLFGRSVQTQLRSAAFVAGDRKAALYSDALGQGGGFFLLLFAGPLVEWDLAWVLTFQASLWWWAALLCWCRFEGRSQRSLPLRLVAGSQWRFGRWLAGMAAVRWLSSNAFLLSLAAQVGPQSVGLLRGLQSIVGVVNLGLAALESVLPTSASLRRKASGDRAALVYLLRFAALCLLPVGLLCGAIYLLADPLLHWVLDGQAIPEAKPALVALIVLPLATLASTLYGIAYRTLERTDRLFAYYLLIALLVAWIAPMVVHEYGVIGAAWGVALQPAALAVLLAWGLRGGKRRYGAAHRRNALHP